MKRDLPIGIQTFREIRENGHYYVDKTGYARRLVEKGKHYFLSRPRRFGKSLFVDTLKELFEGAEPLFRGLDVHGHWDWSVRHPVLRLDFSVGDFNDPDWLREDVATQLDLVEEEAGIRSGSSAPPARFRRLIAELHKGAGQRVVVLVDEYDKPIFDALGNPELARANRDFLRGLYSAVKFGDAHIRFTLLTGVSKFSKVNLFSGLNNLIDITLEPEFSAICGYTDDDLDAVFAPELVGLDRDEIRYWYNGYSWLGGEKVYNPFDVLLLFRRREFGAYWFQTGTPTFLVDALLRQGVASSDLEGLSATDALLSASDMDDMSVEALLFQSGYLTIRDVEKRFGRIRYRLGYPNQEVKESLNGRLLNVLLPRPSRRLAEDAQLRELLAENDFDGLEAEFRSFFASIPYQWHVKNDIGGYEGYYASVVYSWFAAAGLDVRVEESGARGRLDMAVLADGRVYLFEFKMVDKEPEGTAQLRDRDYAAKYRRLGQPIHLIGIEFSRKDHNVMAFSAEPA